MGFIHIILGVYGGTEPVVVIPAPDPYRPGRVKQADENRSRVKQADSLRSRPESATH